jgi:hypothetical protein
MKFVLINIFLLIASSSTTGQEVDKLSRLRRRTNGTCGGGNKGNGICPVSGECCSEWGWCGTSPQHCPSPTVPVLPPVLPPVPTSPSIPTPGDQCLDERFFNDLSKRLSSEFNSQIFLSQTPANGLIPSSVYKFGDFITALNNLQSAGSQFQFWVGDECDLFSKKVALVNMAAFLGQAMRETIFYNACDENNYDKWIASRAPPAFYPMSSSCGQLGQDYSGEDYDCDDACPENSQMQLEASTNADWWGAPPPLFCGPKSTYNNLGYWNPLKSCGGPNNSCEGEPFHYDGQQGGVYVPMSADPRYPNFYYANPLPDENGVTPNPRPPARTNVEGCCWWGRGVIQTTGRCNFGKLNKNLGAGAGPNAPYRNIDFCQDPSAICTGPSELKWVAGIYYWISSVQNYNRDGFNFKEKVKEYVQIGCADDPNKSGCGFLFDAASGIVNRGCHDHGVTCGKAHQVDKRIAASKQALGALMTSIDGGTNPTPTTPIKPTPGTGGTCGNGNEGNGICPISGECCSKWGWCGTPPQHCPSPTPVTKPTTGGTDGTCGGGARNNGICPTPGECCSKWGWCGTSRGHCT